jgi:hypothetical protein
MSINGSHGVICHLSSRPSRPKSFCLESLKPPTSRLSIHPFPVNVLRTPYLIPSFPLLSPRPVSLPFCCSILEGLTCVFLRIHLPFNGSGRGDCSESHEVVGLPDLHRRLSLVLSSLFLSHSHTHTHSLYLCISLSLYLSISLHSILSAAPR